MENKDELILDRQFLTKKPAYFHVNITGYFGIA